MYFFREIFQGFKQLFRHPIQSVQIFFNNIAH